MRKGWGSAWEYFQEGRVIRVDGISVPTHPRLFSFRVVPGVGRKECFIKGLDVIDTHIN